MSTFALGDIDLASFVVSKCQSGFASLNQNLLSNFINRI